MDGVRAAITGRMGWSGGSVSGSWPAICAISPRPRSNKAQQERNSAVKLGIVEPPSPLQARLSISHRILVLQLELGFCSSQSPFVMIRSSNGLMVTPKERPGKGLSVCDRLLPDQGPDQA